MGTTRARRLCAAANGVLLWAVWSAASTKSANAERADDPKRACIAQHEQGQTLRRASKFTEARKALLACAQDSCPSAVRSDCVEWLGSVSNAIPSVVVSAKLRDKDEYNVRVFIDNELAFSRLDGRAIELNPGPHTFRFEAPPEDPIEQQVLLVEGEKSRMLAIRFGHPELETLGKDGGAGPAPDLYRPMPTLVYILGGVAVAGVAGFATFGLLGKNDKSSLQSSCSPFCAKSQVDSVRLKFIVADAALGTAVLSILVGGYVYLTRPAMERAPAPGSLPPRAPLGTSFFVVPNGSGALLGLEGEL